MSSCEKDSQPPTVDAAGEKSNFPKAELHCHLDGCFRLTTIIDLARKRHIPLPSYDLKVLAEKYCNTKRCSGLDEYLDRMKIFWKVFYGDLESIARITREAIEDKAEQNVAYLELRLCPHLMTNWDSLTTDSEKEMINGSETNDVTPREVLQTVCETAATAAENAGIVVRIILCCIVTRPEWSMEIAHMCQEFSTQGVIAIDIAGAGDKTGGNFSDHKQAYEFCRQHNIHRTAHAGEKGPAAEVEEAIQLLSAERIGHGYHVVDDDTIYADAKQRNIHFEVCPLSSYLTASVDPDLTKHPAVRFMRDGVNFSLSTDDPGIQVSTLANDYEIARKDFGFSLKQLQNLNLKALHSSFVNETTKKELIEKFQAIYDNPNDG